MNKGREVGDGQGSDAPSGQTPADADGARLRPTAFTRSRGLEDIGTLEPSIAHVSGAISIAIEKVDFWYGQKHALHDVNLNIPHQKVTAFIGPSGCGKSTLLRLINRLSDLTEGARMTGTISVEGQNIHSPGVDVNDLRRRVGMVFQKSNPFPKSIFENVAYGLRIGGENRREVLKSKVEQCLRRVGLWDEVKDRVQDSALDLSGGQQQRLCIARAIAVEPDVILMDEPCSALDPIATGKIEDLIEELKRDYTIVIVTHNLQQASRVSDYTAFLWLGRVAEFAPTGDLFTTPRLKLTEDYITGRFG
ncbi:MAG: phosphate ABC transporter ATP-binding protein [Candidatus Eisenbacteria bacterium]|nr:phosphate ABC transporter ATP-binding protein [Candidatus Eisenbacteria bacterium]